MPKFKLHSKYQPTGDQPQAIKELAEGLDKGVREQTLLGVTGSGKTFTMANLIEHYQKPTLVLAHNKTLAAQLYSEFRDFFPDNEVHYFVSYFDYYQPEAYIASSDTYIEKDSAINDEIDRLRHAATVSLLTRPDTIIIASVSCIYGIGSPDHYTEMSLALWKEGNNWALHDSWYGKNRINVVGNSELTQSNFLTYLVAMQYHRNDLAFERGNFRVMGDTVDLYPASGEVAYRFIFGFDTLEDVRIIDPLTGQILEKPDELFIFPNTHYATPKGQLERALSTIQTEFDARMKYFERHGKLLEAQRLSQRTKYDLEMLKETGFVKGIENYSRHLDGRKAGEPPATLLDFFPKDFLLLVDESHMTLPQVRGMYNGDHARKETLVEYGFRLPSALDNRPLTFNEFERHIHQAIYVSATPGEYELEHSPEPVEQVIRPTGLLDPEIEVRATDGQIDDLMEEIDQRIAKNQRVLVTTLTKRMAEDLSDHLKERGVKTAYIHSDIDTLERGDILRDLREGVYDVLVGINLLREGLDLPEVSLVAILDADKEGFLRSESALIQTIGRAARHVEGKVIMYGDHITESMEKAISETNRRREIQQEYNKKHHITPKGISKEISAGLRAIIPEKEQQNKLDLKKVPPEEIPKLVKQLESEMKLAAANLEFERAASLRDLIEDIKSGKAQKK
ncbi:excinuclease ABC subunit UvrB [Candidatus Saccharibacteria bacterium]|nr:excinuclease ABC subunit UvrB [Candidatus Saccharibacteria bacterium]